MLNVNLKITITVKVRWNPVSNEQKKKSFTISIQKLVCVYLGKSSYWYFEHKNPHLFPHLIDNRFGMDGAD